MKYCTQLNMRPAIVSRNASMTQKLRHSTYVELPPHVVLVDPVLLGLVDAVLDVHVGVVFLRQSKMRINSLRFLLLA